jgi:6-phosphogluconate dehydrogenase
MVHNGIDYAEMQLLAELYELGLAGGKDPDAIADLLETWKGAATGSYLLDITSTILREKENGDWLVNKIIDQASNKGTGNWATIEMSREGIPATLIATALFARYLSAYKSLRTGLEAATGKNLNSLVLDEQLLRAAYELARIINHFQGFWLIGGIFSKQGWKADFSEIARIWTNGCIIRSGLMQELVTEFEKDNNLFLSEFFIQKLHQLRPSLTKLVSLAIAKELAVPCFSEAVNFINALTTGKSTANLIQAQRDYFGAHTYQRYDGKPEQYFHNQWPEDL